MSDHPDLWELVETRAQALYHIARTFGIPNPPDDTQLNLGVAALKRFLEAYPAHPLAVRAAYEGGSWSSRGRRRGTMSGWVGPISQ